VSFAVAGADPGDSDQARDLLCLHLADKSAGRGRQKRDLPERAGRCAERTDDGIPALDGRA
jgi:hypothetical protein